MSIKQHKNGRYSRQLSEKIFTFKTFKMSDVSYKNRQTKRRDVERIRIYYLHYDFEKAA